MPTDEVLYSSVVAAVTKLEALKSALLNYDSLPEIKSFDIDNECRRLTLWANNIGALQPPSKQSSLDHRLREAPQVRRQVTRLLDRLGRSAHQATEICSGKALNRTSEYSSSDDDNGNKHEALQRRPISEIEELCSSITGLITRLFKLSMAIRNPAPRDRYAKLASIHPVDTSFDIAHVIEKFPTVQQWLAERLGRANAQRRDYFRYRRLHQEKLAREIPTLNAQEERFTGHPSSNIDVIDPGGQIQPQPEEIRPVASTLGSTKATTYVTPSPTRPIDHNDNQSDVAMSETSFATSVDEQSPGRLQVPPPPSEYAANIPFVCPYCFHVQAPKSAREWKKHVYHDLRPYICTFETCTVKPFENRRLWFDHELACHRKEWLCSLCDANAFQTSSAFLHHLKSSHPNDIGERQYDSMVDLCGESLDRINPSDCPFCDEWAKSMKLREQTLRPETDGSTVVVTPVQFRRHLASHMEQLALFALPKSSAEMTSAQGSNDAIMDNDTNERSLDSAPTVASSSSDPQNLEYDRGFCHDCHHEWDHLRGVPQCPNCESEWVEVVSKAPASDRSYNQRSGEVDPVLLDTIRRELEMQYSTSASGQAFLVPSKAHTTLTYERVSKLFGQLYWYTEADGGIIQHKMCLVVCILIAIRFERWYDFKTIFMLDAPITDNDLPLRDAAMVPQPFRAPFLQQQYISLPVIFVANTHKNCDVRMCLPFLSEEPVLDHRASGSVTKVTVEQGCLKSDDSHGLPTKVVMVRRKFQKRPRTRFEFLSSYATSITETTWHNSFAIEKSFCTFEHGDDLSLLHQWADGGNLHHFLYGSSQVVQYYLARPAHITPYDLLQQACNLAAALDYVHRCRTDREGHHVPWMHCDLRPERILVYGLLLGNSDSNVGRWMIRDFDVCNGHRLNPSGRRSEFKLYFNHDALAPRTMLSALCETSDLRRSGPYQPPEVADMDATNGVAKDLWSFGCILAMVLAFALGGPDEVEHQRMCRFRRVDEYFYIRSVRQGGQRSDSGVLDAELDPEFRSWLMSRAPSLVVENSDWIDDCVDIILGLLEINPELRPNMAEVVERLRYLLDTSVPRTPSPLWDSHGQRASLQPTTDLSGQSADPASNPSTPAVVQRTVTSEIHFVRLHQSTRWQFSAICPTGLSAVFWTTDQIQVYDLGQLADDLLVWQHTGTETATLPITACIFQHMDLSTYGDIEHVAIRGSYLAIVCNHSRQGYSLRTFWRGSPQDARSTQFMAWQVHRLDSKPYEIEMSSGGSVFVQFSGHGTIFTTEQDIPIAFHGHGLINFVFASDGESYCRVTNYQNYVHWEIWECSQQVQLSYGTAGMAKNHTNFTLIPLNGPQFVFHDALGAIHILQGTADKKALRLAHPVKPGSKTVMLPKDENSFFLIAVSPRTKSTVEEIRLAYTDTDVEVQQNVLCHTDLTFDSQVHHRICIRPHTSQPNTWCLLNLHTVGFLGRTMFRA